ncbi:MAG: hypothetical protein IJ264_04610 [Clostridia bacterium]|nr:hypothetical protein [Clostridia bacterium]
MKKTFNIVIMFLILGFCLFGCNSDITETNPTLSDTTTKIFEENKNITEAPTGIGQTDIGEGMIVQEKYRQCYYQIFYQLAQLVDPEELGAWEDEVYALDPDETNEMIVKLFIQHFNISKEDFEKANLELAKALYEPGSEIMMNPKDYVNQEMYEIYNADIIYTFDDETINEYYLSGDYPYIYPDEFEDAVERGEYTPQTVWVDVNQLEAEIIAKYGEAEHVSEISEETTYSTPENDVAKEQPEVTTNEQTP